MTNKMKKILSTLILILSFSIMSNAQVFLIDDGIDNPRIVNEEFSIVNPGWHNSGQDWFEEYVPVGNGALLLAALGGAYMLGKKRKK